MQTSKHRNLIMSVNLTDYASDGVSFEWDADGWLHVHGTNTASGEFSGGITSKNKPIHLDAGKYVISVEVEGGGLGAYNYIAVWTIDDGMRIGIINSSSIHSGLSVTKPADVYLWVGVGKGVTVDYRMRLMIVDGYTPAAWSPVDGETLVGVGARISADALHGITPELLGDTTQNGIWYETTAGGDCLRYQLEFPAHADNQTFSLAATVCGDSDGWMDIALEYADAAGRANRAMERLDFTTEPARRKVSIVVPSGMAVTALYVSRDESQPASRVASIALWQGELIADYGLALDVGTSGDIALDVRAVYR